MRVRRAERPRMSVVGIGPTELRILLAAGTLALFRDPHVDFGVFGRLALFDAGALAAIAALVAALALGAVRNTHALAPA